MVVKRPSWFLLLLSVTGTVLRYFVSHHFTECKGDPRAHHEEVEVLCAPNGLRFSTLFDTSTTCVVREVARERSGVPDRPLTSY